MTTKTIVLNILGTLQKYVRFDLSALPKDCQCSEMLSSDL